MKTFNSEISLSIFDIHTHGLALGRIQLKYNDMQRTL